MSTPRPHQVPEYLDLDVELGPGTDGAYPAAIISSPAGEVRDTTRMPFDQATMASQMQRLELALLRSATRSRRLGSPDNEAVQAFGQALMDTLFPGALRTSYARSLDQAQLAGKRLRLRLRVQDPELATLPWEFLFDPEQGEYLALSRRLSIARYIERANPIPATVVTPPLRILAMAAGPSDLPTLDASNERQRMQSAVGSLTAAGLVEVTWLEGGSWRELQRALRRGPWHVFHFIGHGGFSAATDEGLIALEGDDGKAQFLSATDAGRLLADHASLRLVVLNSCQGAEGSHTDLHSSTAASLVDRGIPAVIAMQYEITDTAAIEFSRSLYEALADEQPIDAAVTEARIAVRLALSNSLEWGTPVLSMRAADAALFRLAAARGRRRPTATAPPDDGLPAPAALASSPVAPRTVSADARRIPADDTPLEASTGFAVATPAPVDAAEVSGYAASARTGSVRYSRKRLPLLVALLLAVIVLAGGAAAVMVLRTSGTHTSLAATPPAGPALLSAAPAVSFRPDPYLARIHPLSPAARGKLFQFEVVGRNAGTAGGTGAIAVSSPDQTGLSVEKRSGCTSAAQTRIHTAGDQLSPFVDGSEPGVVRDRTSPDSLPRTQAALDPLVSVTEATSWPAGQQCTMLVTVPVLTGSTATFYLRMTINARTPDGSATADYVNYPAQSSTSDARGLPQTTNLRDQQNLPIIIWTVPVQR